MEFYPSNNLYLLISIVGLIALPLIFLLYKFNIRSNISNLIDTELLNKLINTKNIKLNYLKKYRVFITITCVFFLIVALLRPQVGVKYVNLQKLDRDIIIALDLSESMLADDLSPNRLKQAKYQIQELLRYLRGERVGLVGFTGVAFLESPLTVDYASLEYFLDFLEPEEQYIKGTNIEEALSVSFEALQQSERGIIYLITDGENFTGNYKNILSKMNNHQIVIVGIGSENGSMIRTSRGLKRDYFGKPVLSKLNKKYLSEVAADLKAKLIFVSENGTELADEYQSYVEQLEYSKAGGRVRVSRELFQAPLFLGIIAYLCLNQFFGFSLFSGKSEGASTNVKNLQSDTKENSAFNLNAEILADKGNENKNKVGAMQLSILLFFSFLLNPVVAISDEYSDLGKAGVELASKGKFREAIEKFKEAINIKESYSLLKSRGFAEYKIEDFAAATKSFTSALKLAKDDEELAEGLFNLGNALAQEGKFDQAIKSYEESIKLADREDAKINLELVKRLKEEQKSKKEQKNKNSKQDKQERSKDNNGSSDDKKSSEENQSSDGSSENQERGEGGGEKSEEEKTSDGSKQLDENNGDSKGESSPENQRSEESKQGDSSDKGEDKELGKDSLEEKNEGENGSGNDSSGEDTSSDDSSVDDTSGEKNSKGAELSSGQTQSQSGMLSEKDSSLIQFLDNVEENRSILNMFKAREAAKKLKDQNRGNYNDW